jgi:hypothetical protein
LHETESNATTSRRSTVLRDSSVVPMP